MRHRLLLSALLLLLTWAPAARGQDPERPIFVDSLTVDVINVEVFVADRDGRPVVGLEAGDFEIREDGQPVEITNFFTVARPDPVGESLDRDLAELAVEPRRRTELQLLPEDQQLNLAVYVDHFNLHPHYRKRVLDELEGFLEDRLIQGDRVMLVGFKRRLEVVEPFTRDRQRIVAGLRRMAKETAHRPVDDAERRRIMKLMTGSVVEEAGIETAYQLLRSYVQSAQSDLRFTARALQQFVRSLAGLPGRKAVLYVSSGLPQRPGEELYQHLLDVFGPQAFTGDSGSAGFIDPTMETLREDQSHLFDRIIRDANAHQVTLYTLDARGSAGESTLSAEFGTLSAAPGGRVAFDQMRTANLQEPLVNLAATTGGKSILNTFNFEGALTGVAEDFDTFYSLGYKPPEGRDGKYHAIEVKVKRPGVKVRHRTGYEAKPEAERVADRTLSSLLLGMEKNPLGVRVEFGELEKKSSGKFEMPILVRIPIQEVTLIFQEQGAEGRLRIYVVVQDQKGISDMHEQPYPVSIPSDQLEAARGREIGYAATLRLRKGTPKIAVGVWDELSGVESFVQQHVLVELPKERKKRGS